MDKLTIKKGFEVPLAGKPSKNVKDLRWVSQLSIDPNTIPYLDYELKVTDGQHVRRGETLFASKEDEKILFLSPGAGVLTFSGAINILLDKEESDVVFPEVTSVEDPSAPPRAR